jgi:hypothetical protein
MMDAIARQKVLRKPESVRELGRVEPPSQSESGNGINSAQSEESSRLAGGVH